MKKIKTKSAQPAKASPVFAVAPDDIENRTRIMAHQMFEKRGRQPGRDLEDWLAAERDLADNPLTNIKGVKDLKNKSTIG